MKLEKLKQYHRGEWSEVELPSTYEVADKDWRFDDYLEGLGFYGQTSTTVGDANGFGLSFHHERDRGKRVLVDVSDGSQCEQILLLDLLDEIFFLKEFGTAVAAAAVQFQLEQLTEMGEKTFRLEHGHDATSICPECDPIGYENLRAARERLRAER